MRRNGLQVVSFCALSALAGRSAQAQGEAGAAAQTEMQAQAQVQMQVPAQAKGQRYLNLEETALTYTAKIVSSMRVTRSGSDVPETDYTWTYDVEGYIAREVIPPGDRVRLSVIPRKLTVLFRDNVTGKLLSEQARVEQQLVDGPVLATLDRGSGWLTNSSSLSRTAEGAIGVQGAVLDTLFVPLPAEALTHAKTYEIVQTSAFLDLGKSDNSPEKWNRWVTCEKVDEDHVSLAFRFGEDAPIHSLFRGEFIRLYGKSLTSTQEGVVKLRNTPNGLLPVHGRSQSSLRYDGNSSGNRGKSFQEELSADITITGERPFSMRDIQPVKLAAPIKDGSFMLVGPPVEGQALGTLTLTIKNQDVREFQGERKIDEAEGGVFTIRMDAVKKEPKYYEIDAVIVDVARLPLVDKEQESGARRGFQDYGVLAGKALRLRVDRSTGAISARSGTDDQSLLDFAIESVGSSIPTEPVALGAEWTTRVSLDNDILVPPFIRCKVTNLEGDVAVISGAGTMRANAAIENNTKEVSAQVTRQRSALLPQSAVFKANTTIGEGTFAHKFGARGSIYEVTWKLER